VSVETLNGQEHAPGEEHGSGANGAAGAPALPPASAESKRRQRIREAVKVALEGPNGATSGAAPAGNGAAPAADGAPGGARKSKRAGKNALRVEDTSGVDYELRPMPKELAGLVPSIVKPMPRRKVARGTPGEAISFNIQPKLRLNANVFQVLARSVVWWYAMARFILGTLEDKLHKRDSTERRAARLVRSMQQVGGTIVKIGQQLAMRIDLLPYAYCREMSKLLDSVRPFPVEQAIKKIEASLGKRMDEVFSSFDPTPIGSASIACVYQAKLRTGEKVAVKVRRPGAETTFAADIRAFKWFIALMDALTLTRPGLMHNFIVDFESSLTEELDFRKEARYQDIFRRTCKRKRLTRRPDYFSAPKVYFELSGSEVIVQEFISGVWAWELIAAVEQNDEAALARMRQLNVDPKIVAKRLLWAAFWGTMSNVVFHADPHPANIVVQEDNKLVFIDFGACGSVNSTQRQLQLEMFHYQARDDIHGMVQAAMALLEPLPPVEIHELEKELEASLGDAMYGHISKNSPWYERTSAALWLKLFEVTRKYELPVNLDTVRMFRANMLYDSLAIRLDNDIRPWEEFDQFTRDSASLVKRRLRRRVTQRLSRGGPLNQDYAFLNQVLQSGSRAFFKFNSFLNRRFPDFNYMVEKSVFTAMVLVRLVFTVVAVLATAVGGMALLKALRGEPLHTGQILEQVATNNWVQGLLAFVALLDVRRIMFRLGDRDINNNNT
jgi:ubiquinone biosynthesis protein